MGACNSAAAAAPVSLDIYWDVENCGCARTAKGAAEMHARLMDFITGAAGAGHSVAEATARGARTLSFYVPARSSAAPRPAALKALDTLGWRHVAVSPKPGAADLAIQRDVDAMLASAAPSQLRRRVAVCVEIKSSTRLQFDRMRPFRRELFCRVSRTRREQSIRPKISRIDFDLTELESSEVWWGPPKPVAVSYTHLTLPTIYSV